MYVYVYVYRISCHISVTFLEFFLFLQKQSNGKKINKPVQSKHCFIYALYYIVNKLWILLLLPLKSTFQGSPFFFYWFVFLVDYQ